jgi:hypothetical protein
VDRVRADMEVGVGVGVPVESRASSPGWTGVGRESIGTEVRRRGLPAHPAARTKTSKPANATVTPVGTRGPSTPHPLTRSLLRCNPRRRPWSGGPGVVDAFMAEAVPRMANDEGAALRIAHVRGATRPTKRGRRLVPDQ